LDSLVHIASVNQIEPSQDLLGLGERTVRDGHFSVAHPHRRSSVNGLKRLRSKAAASISEGLVVSHTRIIGHGPDLLFFTVDKTQVPHWTLLIGLSVLVQYFNTIVRSVKQLDEVMKELEKWVETADEEKLKGQAQVFTHT
jgi:hypothetical protein